MKNVDLCYVSTCEYLLIPLDQCSRICIAQRQPNVLPRPKLSIVGSHIWVFQTKARNLFWNIPWAFRWRKHCGQTYTHQQSIFMMLVKTIVKSPLIGRARPCFGHVFSETYLGWMVQTPGARQRDHWPIIKEYN